MPSAKRLRLRLRKMLAGFVFWAGLVLIGIIAIPTGILFGMIALLWEALGFLLKKLDNA